jgi:hypothetical protein
MAMYNVIFESEEIILGIIPKANDWVEYSGTLKIKDGGKLPITLDMQFNPPHPFSVNMPMQHSIEAESISSLYGKVIKFLAKYGVEFRG